METEYNGRNVQEEGNRTAIKMEGIDTAVGLEYAAQDEELYREVLADYADAIEEQAAVIESALAAGDGETYTIEVHSLKSMSKTIGALALSDMARKLEEAGRSGAWDVIVAETPKLLSVYRGLGAVIGPYLARGEEETETAGEPADRRAVSELRAVLQGRLDAFDTDGIDEIVAELQGFDLTGDPAVFMRELVSAWSKFDYGRCRMIVLKWRETDGESI